MKESLPHFLPRADNIPKSHSVIAIGKMQSHQFVACSRRSDSRAGRKIDEEKKVSLRFFPSFSPCTIYSLPTISELCALLSECLEQANQFKKSGLCKQSNALLLSVRQKTNRLSPLSRAHRSRFVNIATMPIVSHPD